MIITSETKYADFAEYEEFVDEASKAEIKQQAERYFKPCHTLTLDEFWGIMRGDYSLIGDATEPTVLQIYWCKRFSDFCEEFAKECERMHIQPTPEETAAQNGTIPMEAQEAMLVFTREYFGLPSFFAAGERTIGEYLTARKDRYNQDRARRNYEAAQRAKMKKKK